MAEGGNRVHLYEWIIFAIVGLALLAIIAVNATNLGLPSLEGAPEGARAAADAFIGIARPFVEILFFLVTPAGEDENVQMIAFSIFLLIVLVGSKTLNYAFRKQPFLAFFISIIIGIIAARSLTATVLRESALAASPIAVVSLLLGFIPIFALVRNMERWSLTNLSKMAIYAVTAFVYLIIFWTAFDAVSLGLVYATGIIVMGAGEAIAKSLAPKIAENENKKTGRFLRWAGEVETTAKQMEEGSREN